MEPVLSGQPISVSSYPATSLYGNTFFTWLWLHCVMSPSQRLWYVVIHPLSTSLACSRSNLSNKEVSVFSWSLRETGFKAEWLYKVVSTTAFDSLTNDALAYLVQFVTKCSVHRDIDDWVTGRMHARYKSHWMKNNSWNANCRKWLQKMDNDKRGPTHNKNEKHRENHLRCLRFTPKIFLWLPVVTPSLHLPLVETHLEENS